MREWGLPRRLTMVRLLLITRLRPGRLGPTLIVGFAATFGLGAAFAELLDGVLEGDGLTGVDKPLTRYLVAHRTPGWTRLFIVLTDLGGAAVLVTLTALIALLIVWRSRSWRPMWVAAMALGGCRCWCSRSST